MPATGPIPEEVAGCFKKAGEYGRFVISSGPYMIEGSDQARRTSCNTLKPISGLDPNSQLIPRPEPELRPGDRRQARENNIDGSSSRSTRTSKDIFNKIEAGELEGEVERAAGRDPAEYSRTRSCKDGSSRTGRPHLVHHDEPDAAAVRRHPRPQGGELDHGQGRPPAERGAARSAATSRTTSFRTRCSTATSRTTPRTRPRATRATRRRPRKR